MLGFYVHIPFCEKICDYCDFRVMPAASKLYDEYTELLLQEMTLFGERHPGVFSRTETLYLGGGTPSILPGRCLKRIFEAIKERGCGPFREISMEFNPESCTEESVGMALECGVRRFSLGLQTFSRNLLDRIGRKHTVERGIEALKLLTAIPKVKVSADLMFNLPGQTVKSFLQDVDRLSDFPLGHVSFYGLNVGGRTLLGKRVERGEEKIDEDLYEPMYLGGVEILEKKGFLRYEVSNFAKPGEESLHNRNYWERGEYLGFGPGAHSFFKGRRFCAPEMYPRWRDYVRAGAPDDLLTYDDLDENDVLTERVWLSLRQRSGLDLATLTADGILVDASGYDSWVKKRFAVLENNRLKLVGKGWVFMDGIVTDVLNACSRN